LEKLVVAVRIIVNWTLKKQDRGIQMLMERDYLGDLGKERKITLKRIL
jgi:hypothetical protein